MEISVRVKLKDWRNQFGEANVQHLGASKISFREESHNILSNSMLHRQNSTVSWSKHLNE
eukprot:746033-Hanusia_phi.AAC.3